MSLLRRLATSIGAWWILARSRLAARAAPTSRWLPLRPTDDLASSYAGPDFWVVAQSEVPRSAMARLVAALEVSGRSVACGVVFSKTDSPRSPVVVETAGYEVGVDRNGPLLLPLLHGVGLCGQWGRAVTTAPVPGGPVVALTADVLESALEAGWRPADGPALLSNRLPEGSESLVVWSVLTEGRAAPATRWEGDRRFVEARRHRGEGATVVLLPPGRESPGTPAPPPAAIWSGPVQHRLAAGHDSSSLHPSVAIRHAATDWAVASRWGDHHFANAFRRALERRGIGARVVPHHAWAHPFAARDLVVTIRGLQPAQPVPGRLNVLWIISHPEDVTIEELRGHDLIAVASVIDERRIAAMTQTPTTVLLQATDWERFERPVLSDAEGVGFVGNSRGEERPAVFWALGEGIDVTVAGYGWEGRLPGGRVALPGVPNDQLPDVLNRFRLVLGDHWDDMRRRGYVSNRVFDVAAAGSLLLSDQVVGLDELLPGVVTYGSRAELAELISRWSDPGLDEERMSKVQEQAGEVRRHHTFDVRATQMLEALAQLVPQGSAVVDSLRDPKRAG